MKIKDKMAPHEEEKIAPLTLTMHMPILFIGWLIYFYLFVINIMYSGENVSRIIFLLLIFIVFFFILSVIWILHNLRIYQKKGPRTHVRLYNEKYDEDWHHRKIIADWQKLKKANSIKIEINKTTKTFMEQ